MFSIHTHTRKVAWTLIMIIANQTILPYAAYALTSGPVQPELQSFQPVGTSDMVDLFSGDFSYNIPLFELPGPDGGYPVNLFYNSVTNADQEASFVGLGWNLGIGAVSRGLQGFPDDFNGDLVKRRTDMKPSHSAGVTAKSASAIDELFGAEVGKTLEVLGLETFNFGLGIIYNNYKGFGYSLELSSAIEKSFGAAKLGGNFGLGVNSLEGATSNADMSISFKQEENNRSTELGFGLKTSTSSRMGRSMALSGDIQMSKKLSKYSSLGSSLGSEFDLSRNDEGFMPSPSNPMTGLNINLGLKIAPAFSGVFGFINSLSFSGYYATRHLKNRNETNTTPAFGGMYLQNADQEGLQDFSREKDGMLYNTQPNLAMPSFSADIISVNGHGLLGNFQLQRSDIPIFRDEAEYIRIFGQSRSIDIGPGPSPHIGANAGGSLSVSNTECPLPNLGAIGAKGKILNDPFENFYLKSGSDVVANDLSDDDYLGKDAPVSLDLNGLDFGNQLRAGNTTLPTNVLGRSKRKTKATNILPLTNAALIDNNNQIIYPEYQVQYYQQANGNSSIVNYPAVPTVSPNRNKKYHVGGYSVTGAGGSKWIFGLPVKNMVQKDVTFSVARPSGAGCVRTVPVPQSNGDVFYKVDGTDHYFDMTEMPEYTHTHLLTSVLGADYIDVNPNDGLPNDLDKGYWVRIEYIKTSDNFKWRSPFNGANYNAGLANKDEDDKGSFTYGEREQFHPAKMISKTHEARFHYSPRFDARGVSSWIQNQGSALGDYSYKLDSVSIYAKSELLAASAEGRTPVAMKKVHFEYSYTLCPGVPNNPQTAANKGKLTLRKVWFTYENNTRGALSPYKFDYANGRDSSLAPYSEMAFDRWGVYKPIASNNPCQNISNPFVDQSLTEAQMDELVSSWHLTDIYLPSGSHIKLELGRDHYGHEQNVIAGQMFQIAGVTTYGGNFIDVSYKGINDINSQNRKVYFNLEPGTVPQSDPNAIDKYFAGLYTSQDNMGLPHGYNAGKQMYFQINTDLLGTGNPNLFQDISGYATIESYSVVPTSVVNGFYTQGVITLKPFPLPTKDNKYFHPFAVHSWQFIKQNLTDAMYGFASSSTPSSDQEIAAFWRRLFAVFGEVRAMFRNYYKAASDRGLASMIEPANSFIRLSSPDKKVYGDGVRVKKVLLYDDWEAMTGEKTPVYGTIYDYDEADGSSSGVATATPMIGKQESALRYVRNYVQSMRDNQDQLSFVEYPVNESYYPGASVGYRRVTVKSLATEYAIKREKGETLPTELPNNLPSEFATSGVTVNEFYTAKDYPIIVKETAIQQKTHKRQIPAVFYNETADMLTASQGYAIELNNMHGRQRKVSDYATDRHGRILQNPISWIEYEYLDKPITYSLPYPISNDAIASAKVVTNEVPIIWGDKDPSDTTKVLTKTMELGVDREFFMDVRENSDETWNAEIQFNTDIVGVCPFCLPAFVPLPSVSRSYSRVRTAATNKIIRRSGILIKTTAYDGQSKVVTENKAFDKYTGQPLLTTVNNNFDDYVYNYTTPGYFVYPKMDGAYNNLNLWFTTEIGAADCDGYYPMNNVAANVANLLEEGDEYVFRFATSINAIDEWNNFNPLSRFPTIRGTLVKKHTDVAGTKLMLAMDAPPTYSGLCVGQVVRSGKRNLLTASVGSVSALKNPTQNRYWNTCMNILSSVTTQPITPTCTVSPIVQDAVNFLNAVKDYGVGQSPNMVYTYQTGGNANINSTYAALLANTGCESSYDCINYMYYSPGKMKGSLYGGILGPRYYFGIRGITYANGQPAPITVWTLIDNAITNGTLGNYTVVGGDCSTTPCGAVIKTSIPSGSGGVDEFHITLTSILCQTDLAVKGPSYTVTINPNYDTMYVPYKAIDSVITISATRYSDTWAYAVDDLGLTVLGENLFKVGKRGIFRPSETWSYADTRIQSNPVNLRKDGVVNGVTLFDWLNPFTGNCAAFSNWKKTETIMGYANNGEPNESKNILDIYSAALYGYNGNLPIAVGGNGKKDEIAFESFEEYPATTDVSTITARESGNFNFLPSAANIITSQTVPLFITIAPTIAVTPIPYNVNAQLPYKATVNITSLGYASPTNLVFDVPISGMSQYLYTATATPYNATGFELAQGWDCWINSVDPKNKKIGWSAGTITLYYSNPPVLQSSILQVSGAVAHAGTKSLVLPTGTTTLPQRMLRLPIGKEYLFSAWVKVNSPDSYTYSSLVQAILDGTTITPKGQIIDGWQRVEGVFTTTHSSPSLKFVNTTTGSLYVDDIRIYPKDGSLQTYVYDPISYKVTATLDANNYMAKYKYDRQGTLISVQKETPQGLKTIQETGSHIKSNN